ncbi:MAG: hypothetical protein OXF67_08890, partial [Cyanobacteria bacterium MAG CAR4_bin_6]|nr:hypothetical protein [Cyanobacteria bacterium MAG CAR4_bin_6]
IPTVPDCYSVMAIDSLTRVIPKWNTWSSKAQELPILREATYPFPKVKPKFLGTIIQKYRPRAGSPTQGFREWINQINKKVTKGLYPALKKIDMTLPDSAYGGMDKYCLASIPDFNNLIARSQEAQKPVYALDDTDIGHSGVVLERDKESKARFGEIFSDLGKKVIQLTGYANGN